MKIASYAGRPVVRKTMLTRIFDLQVENLRRIGIELEKKDLLKIRAKIPNCIEISHHRNFSMLLVVPFSVVPLRTQFQAVDLGNKKGKKGYTFLNPTSLLHAGSIVPPEELYLICDIEDGKDTLNQSPEECEEIFSGSARFPLTVNQGLSMVIQWPVILQDHYLQLGGSRIKDSVTKRRYVPDLYVFANRLKMNREEPDDADPRWGNPSYGSIITLDS